MSDEAWRKSLFDLCTRTIVAIHADTRDILSSVTIIRELSVPSDVIAQLKVNAAQVGNEDVLHWVINGVYTIPNARRRGTGQRLMEEALKFALK